VRSGNLRIMGFRTRTEESSSPRGVGLLVSWAAYVAALCAAIAVVRAAGIIHPLVALALGNAVATFVVFLTSVAANNSSIYDPYWGLQPLAAAGYYLWVGWGEVGARQILVTVLVVLYSLRLTSNFYRDWPGLRKEDFRYVSFRAASGRAYWLVSLLGIHLFPTIAVYLGCLPLYALTRPGAPGLNWLDGIAALVVLGAVLTAFTADEQLRAFRNDPRNRGCSILHGLWAYSRHPNYLGEISTWWGLWLFALAAGPRWWWTVGGAALITMLFVFISVPMMEKRASATRAGYEAYREATPVLVPRRHRRVAAQADGSRSCSPRAFGKEDGREIDR
jgi:steroid 5-alpha reductase family enzyme